MKDYKFIKNIYKHKKSYGLKKKTEIIIYQNTLLCYPTANTVKTLVATLVCEPEKFRSLGWFVGC